MLRQSDNLFLTPPLNNLCFNVDEMADWSQNDFMDSWDKAYVTTNLKAGDKPYAAEMFLALNEQLCNDAPELKPVSHSIIVRENRRASQCDFRANTLRATDGCWLCIGQS